MSQDRVLQDNYVHWGTPKKCCSKRSFRSTHSSNYAPSQKLVQSLVNSKWALRDVKTNMNVKIFDL